MSEEKAQWQIEQEKNAAALAMLDPSQLVRLVLRLQMNEGRLRKRLKKAQERAERLQAESGLRFLRSNSAKFLAMYQAEYKLRLALEKRIRDLDAEVRTARTASGAAALEQVKTLLKQAGIV